MSEMKTTRIFVGGLGDNLGKDDLDREFSKYGKLNGIWVAQNPPGFAFVEFDDDRDADEAVKQMNGVVINGSRLRVEVSRERRGRGRGGFRGTDRRGGRSFGRGSGGSRGDSRSFRGGRGSYDRSPRYGSYDSGNSGGQGGSSWGRRGSMGGGGGGGGGGGRGRFEGSRDFSSDRGSSYDSMGSYDYDKSSAPSYRSRSPTGITSSY